MIVGMTVGTDKRNIKERGRKHVYDKSVNVYGRPHK
jgi:hypothetical protein